MIREFSIYLLELMSWGIVGRALSSWIPNSRSYTLVQILYKFTDPILRPIQNILPKSNMIDFSPLIAIIVIQVMIKVIQS
tara:strand:- start:252 stop:491 length:240 start_codon:yes stop_codon:yes gene_type:complete